MIQEIKMIVNFKLVSALADTLYLSAYEVKIIAAYLKGFSK